MVANATTWLGTRNQIIAQMGHHLGVVPFGDSFTGEQFEAVLFELNAIIKNLELNNLFLWNELQYHSRFVFRYYDRQRARMVTPQMVCSSKSSY
jgi:hypothetical protein